jgi:hypothetical protein
MLSDLRKAKAQMAAYGAGQDIKHIAYVIVNFDDRLHEYADKYGPQIDQYNAGHPVPVLSFLSDGFRRLESARLTATSNSRSSDSDYKVQLSAHAQHF